MAFETIDFETPNPAETAHFFLSSSNDAAFDPQAGCWVISSTKGYMEFNLVLAKHQRASLVLTGYTDAEDTKITIKCNDHNVVHKKPLNQTPGIASTWYISSDLSNPGPNKLILRVSKGTNLYVEKASVLIFEMQRQKETNWCWAAVSASVSSFYDKDPWLQCEVADGALERQDCCVDGKACNIAWFLGDGLQVVGHDRGGAGVLSIEDVANRITRGGPLGIHIQWGNTGKGHFVCITGTNSIHDTLAIQDPAYGTSYMKYSDFKSRYQGSGQWTNSYYTN